MITHIFFGNDQLVVVGLIPCASDAPKKVQHRLKAETISMEHATFVFHSFYLLHTTLCVCKQEVEESLLGSHFSRGELRGLVRGMWRIFSRLDEAESHHSSPARRST